MEHIHLPSTIEFIAGDRPDFGQIVITPCQQGYGTTLGNALRRVLLSSLPGAAVESIKIEGVQHEFAAVDGVLEDVVAVKVHSSEPITLTLVKKGKGVITPADFEKNSDVEIMNPDLKLMTVTTNREIRMEIIVNKGSGYVPVSEKNIKDLPLGTIAIDSLYTPIRDVGYDVELTRVGDITDYEKLTVTIETNGTISPKDAVSQATKILMDHFALILDTATGDGAFAGAKEDEDANVTEVKEENSTDEEVTEKTVSPEDEDITASDSDEKSKKRGRKKKAE